MRRDAIVFLDWDAARRFGSRPKLDIKRVDHAAREMDDVFVALTSIVAPRLRREDSSALFRVRWRLYHGWHSGTSKTFDLRVVEKFIADFKTIAIGKVSFSSDIVPVSHLLCGGRRMPIQDTLRQITEPDGTKVIRQKMVDGALICDLMQSVRSSKDDIHLVFADDDDVLPGLFTAEAWGGNVHMFRRGAGSRHLNTTGLVTVI